MREKGESALVAPRDDQAPAWTFRQRRISFSAASPVAGQVVVEQRVQQLRTIALDAEILEPALETTPRKPEAAVH